MEAALLSSIQTQAADPNGPYQPEDLAYLTMLTVEKNVPLYEAVQMTQRRAQERQAAQAPQGAPETMPGLALPGMGAEMQPTPAGPPSVQGLLAQLQGQPAASANQPTTPGAVLSLQGRL